MSATTNASLLALGLNLNPATIYADAKDTTTLLTLATTLSATSLASYFYLTRTPSSSLVSLLKNVFGRVDTFGASTHTKTQSKPEQFQFGDVRVSKLLIHPIKSCRGISVQESLYTPEGLQYDRIWCIVDANTNSVLTARELPTMVIISPTIEEDDSSPCLGQLVISFPEGSEHETLRIPLHPTEQILDAWKPVYDVKLWGQNDIDGFVCEGLNSEPGQVSAVLSKYLNRQVHLLCKGSRPRPCKPTEQFPKLNATAKYQDGYPLLILSQEGMADIEQETRKRVGTQGVDDRWSNEPFPIERFRPNIVVSGAGSFAEDNWESISIHPHQIHSPTEDSTISVVSKCARCLLPNVDIQTGVRDKAVPYKIISKFRSIDPSNKFKPMVGCNAVPHGSGVLRVGDYVATKRQQ